MPSHPSHPPQAFRVAVLWDNRMLRTQRMLSGFCRKIGVVPGMTMRRFDLTSLMNEKGREPVGQCEPDGLATCVPEPEVMHAVRQMLPGIPIVSVCMVPAELADTVVIGNVAERARIARDHFRSMGMEAIGVFCGGNRDARKRIADEFRQQVPNVQVLSCELDIDSPETRPNGSLWNAVADWLRSLPKPAGVCSIEFGMCEYLSRVCGQIGLRIPQDVQLIGTDDVDGALACTPTLTTIGSPSEEIGEMAADVLLRYLRGEKPPPKPMIEVAGATLIARGSTGQADGTSPAILGALDLIKSQAASGMTAGELPGMIDVGKTTLYKEFVAETGTTPARLLRQERLRQACAMLRDSQANVATIAQVCGFGSASAFARIFRHAIGVSPTEYRAIKAERVGT